MQHQGWHHLLRPGERDTVMTSWLKVGQRWLVLVRNARGAAWINNITVTDPNILPLLQQATETGETYALSDYLQEHDPGLFASIFSEGNEL